MSQSTDNQTSYIDHPVIDDAENEVGKVTDVVYGTSNDHPEDDDGSREPTWLVVNPGLMRAAHYVPVAGSYRSESGSIVVPWTSDWIKSAPKAGSDHVLTDELLAELTEHYGDTATTR